MTCDHVVNTESNQASVGHVLFVVNFVRKRLCEEVCDTLLAEDVMSMAMATEACSPMEVWYFVVHVNLLSNIL